MSDISHHMKAAAVFAESVRRELRHLPAEVVADLTDGLESDIASSLLDGVVLANPSGYANDLLRGAGLAVEKIQLRAIGDRHDRFTHRRR